MPRGSTAVELDVAGDVAKGEGCKAKNALGRGREGTRVWN
jgi:hypothetical protein